MDIGVLRSDGAGAKRNSLICLVIPSETLWWFFAKLPVPDFRQIARSMIIPGFSTNWMRLPWSPKLDFCSPTYGYCQRCYLTTCLPFAVLFHRNRVLRDCLFVQTLKMLPLLLPSKFVLVHIIRSQIGDYSLHAWTPVRKVEVFLWRHFRRRRGSGLHWASRYRLLVSYNFAQSKGFFCRSTFNYLMIFLVSSVHPTTGVAHPIPKKWLKMSVALFLQRFNGNNLLFK